MHVVKFLRVLLRELNKNNSFSKVTIFGYFFFLKLFIIENEEYKVKLVKLSVCR